MREPNLNIDGPGSWPRPVGGARMREGPLALRANSAAPQALESNSSEASPACVAKAHSTSSTDTCNRQGGICMLDWPIDSNTGLPTDFGIAQLKRIAHAVKGTGQ